MKDVFKIIISLHRHEMKQWGVSVIIVEPGNFIAGMHGKVFLYICFSNWAINIY